MTVCLPSLWLFRLGLKVMKTPFSQVHINSSLCLGFVYSNPFERVCQQSYSKIHLQCLQLNISEGLFFSQGLYVMTLENRRQIAVSVQVTQSSCCTSQSEEPEVFRGCFSLNPSSSCPHEGNTQTTTIRSKTPSHYNRSGVDNPHDKSTYLNRKV